MASMAENSRDLVLRARQGDQNAMGMIMMVRDSANRRSSKAILANKAIMDYIKRNPANGTRIGVEARKRLDALKEVSTDAGDDAKLYQALCALLVSLPIVGGKRALTCGSVILANGRPLVKKRVQKIASCIQNEDLQELFLGMIDNGFSVQGLPEEALPFAFAGMLVGKGRGIQLIRRVDTPASIFSSRMGWELGE